MKHLLFLILACLFTAVSLTAETHVLYVDANGSDSNPGTASAPVATLTEALSLAETLQPTAAIPVLIKLGQGEFSAPETDWSLACTHVYFSGNGINNTKIIADTININPDAVTGFKDISLEAVMDIGDTFLPVQQVKVMSLKKTTGQLDGVWYDAAGRLTVSEYEKKSDTQTPFGENGMEQLPEEGSSMPGNGPMFVIPDEDATNTFVLKTGDTMTGALELNRIELVSALTNGYMMTGCSIPACNGFYSTNGNSSGGALVYQNVSNMFLYRYPPGGKSPTYWQIYSTAGSASFYSRYIDYGYTPPVGTWSDGTLGTAVSTNKPSIDFGTGAAINLQDGTAASDAATVGQLNSVSNNLKTYVDNKEFGTANIADGAITGAKIATGAITEAKLGSNSVTTAKLGTYAVTSDKIAYSAVGPGKLDANAVNYYNIVDGGVTEPKIASSAVTVTKLHTGVDDRYVNADGDTLTGFLTLVGDPNNAMHAATMNYVEDSIDTAISNIQDSFQSTLHVFSDGEMIIETCSNATLLSYGSYSAQSFTLPDCNLKSIRCRISSTADEYLSVQLHRGENMSGSTIVSESMIYYTQLSDGNLEMQYSDLSLTGGVYTLRVAWLDAYPIAMYGEENSTYSAGRWCRGGTWYDEHDAWLRISYDTSASTIGSGAANHDLDSDGLFVTGSLEIDGATYIDGNLIYKGQNTDDRYVDTAGDSMTGSLNLGGNALTNVSTIFVASDWVLGAANETQAFTIKNNAAGCVTDWSSGTSKTVTHSLGISGSYAVIITPTSNPGGYYYVSSKTTDAFTVTSTSHFNFDYLIIVK